jgi:hypothetical protein
VVSDDAMVPSAASIKAAAVFWPMILTADPYTYAPEKTLAGQLKCAD